MTDTDRKFFSPRELANRWNTSEKTLERWRMHGSGPVYLKIGGRVLYDVEQIDEHERGRVRVATGRGMPADSDLNVGRDQSYA